MPYMFQSGNSPKVHSPVCETQGCNSLCSFAYSCYEQRMGRITHVAWPIVGLVVLALLALIV
jgi:hypothetical protein